MNKPHSEKEEKFKKITGRISALKKNSFRPRLRDKHVMFAQGAMRFYLVAVTKSRKLQKK